MSRLSEQVFFNGYALNDVVPDSHVLDIIIGSILVEHKMRDGVASPGALFAGKRDGVRTIIIRVELPMEKSTALINYNKLRRWAESDMPQPMYLPDESRGYINVVLSSMTELSIGEWYQPIEMEFTAYDPYFYGVERVATVNTPFFVAGDIDIWYQIEAALPAAITSPAWTLDGNSVIAMTGQIGAGDLMIVTERGLVLLNDDSINASLSLATRFVRLTPGNHIITSAVDSNIKWREGYR